MWPQMFLITLICTYAPDAYRKPPDVRQMSGGSHFKKSLRILMREFMDFCGRIGYDGNKIT